VLISRIQRDYYGTVLTVSSQVSSDKSVELVEFQSLKGLSSNGAVEGLVKNFGVVYVTAITRDGCSGCMEQKPLFGQLAQKMSSDLAAKVRFSNIHVRYADGDKTESWESKKMFRHTAYPTYLVHVRSKKGVLEVFRAVYPTMEELEKQTRESLDLAMFYKDEV
jgi:thiol-disulfide isomerase/thioredoxin